MMLNEAPDTSSQGTRSLPFSIDVTDLEGLPNTLRHQLSIDQVGLLITTAEAEFDGIDDLVANAHAPLKVEEILCDFGKDKSGYADRLRVTRYSTYASGSSASRVESVVKDFLMQRRRNKHPWRGSLAALFIGCVGHDKRRQTRRAGAPCHRRDQSRSR